MELLPKNAWFGLTRPRLRRLLAALLIIIIALFLTWLGLFGFIKWKAHRLAQLESELHKLRVSQSTFADAKRLEAEFSDLMDYASCTGRECRICLRADWYGPMYLQGHSEKLDYLIAKVAELLDRPTLSHIGIRMWFAKATITIADDKVADYRLSVLLEAPNHYWMMASWAMYDKISADNLDFYKQFREKDNYFVHWTHLHVGMETGEGLVALVTPNASATDRKAAQHIETKCLTRFHACTTLCEFFPEAARYQDYLSARWARATRQEAWQRCSD